MSVLGGLWGRLWLALIVAWLAFSPPLALVAWDDGGHVTAAQARAHHAAAAAQDPHHHRVELRPVVVLTPLDGMPYLIPATPIDPTLGTDRLSGLTDGDEPAARFDPPVAVGVRLPIWRAVVVTVHAPPPRTELLA